MKVMANIVIDISARVKGYEQSIKQLQAALDKVDPGSVMAKSISRALEKAKIEVENLSKNMTPKASNDNQIDNIIRKTNHAGESIQNVIEMMNKLGKLLL